MTGTKRRHCKSDDASSCIISPEKFQSLLHLEHRLIGLSWIRHSDDTLFHNAHFSIAPLPLRSAVVEIMDNSLRPIAQSLQDEGQIVSWFQAQLASTAGIR